jgi:hypothetical protein
MFLWVPKFIRRLWPISVHFINYSTEANWVVVIQASDLHCSLPVFNSQFTAFALACLHCLLTLSLTWGNEQFFDTSLSGRHQFCVFYFSLTFTLLKWLYSNLYIKHMIKTYFESTHQALTSLCPDILSGCPSSFLQNTRLRPDVRQRFIVHVTRHGGGGGGRGCFIGHHFSAPSWTTDAQRWWPQHCTHESTHGFILYTGYAQDWHEK